MNPMFYFLTLTAVLAATANAGGPVLDSKGHFIFSGSYYVIRRIFGAAGGGLTLVPRGDKQCCDTRHLLYGGQRVTPDASSYNNVIPVSLTLRTTGHQQYPVI
uniref:Neprosin domain-containing protein n=1 Tax=Brassica oleracea var. oleracea TaxID=109376 RepID=A0A0D3E5F5_BRAOL